MIVTYKGVIHVFLKVKAMEAKCPHCNKMNVYGLIVKDEYEEVVCHVCRRTFFVSNEGNTATDKESINKIVVKEKAHGQLIFLMPVSKVR